MCWSAVTYYYCVKVLMRITKTSVSPLSFWQKGRTSITCIALRWNSNILVLTEHLSQIFKSLIKSSRESALTESLYVAMPCGLSTWQGSAAAMAWHASRDSWQTSSSPVMMRWVTMRVREQSCCWLDDRAELTDSSQSDAAAGSSASVRSMDRATLSSLYQELRASANGGPDWLEGWRN